MLCSCYAWQGWNINVDPSLENRVISDDAVFTYHDVTALTCAQLCASMSKCGFFTYNDAKRQCVFCSTCGNMSLAVMPGYQLFTMSAGQHQRLSLWPLQLGTFFVLLCSDLFITVQVFCFLMLFAEV